MRTAATVIALALTAFLAVGCSADNGGSSPSSAGQEQATTAPDTKQKYPEVITVEVHDEGSTYSFDVTISSPYDTPERYADGWRVLGPDGTVYAEHTLGHDHAAEQPFTRTQTGVTIPADVGEVTVEGRDLENGYGGETMTVELP